MATPIIGKSGSFLDQQAERARQIFAEDSDFLREGIYMFELVVPTEALADRVGPKRTALLVPLIIAPESYQIRDLFTVAKTHTSDGGFYVEESGVHERQLVITGTTGFYPKPSPLRLGYPTARKASGESHNPRPGQGFMHALSGQRHMHFLQDRIFRLYGDLKRDPVYAEDTQLFFHAPHEGEHWEIVPEEFQLRRDKVRRTLYQYNIVATVVGPAKSLAAPSVEADSKSGLERGIEAVKDGIAMVEAALADVRNMIAAITRYARGVVDVIHDVARLVSAVGNAITSAVNGVIQIVTLPITGVDALMDSIGSVLTSLEQVADIPDVVLQSWRQMEDGVATVRAAGTSLFQSVVNIGEGSNRSLGKFGVAQSALDSAQAWDSLQDAEVRQDQPTPGDALRAQNTGYPSRPTPTLVSATPVVVGSEETVQLLATRFLGDARRWREIVALNDLAPPYVSSAGLPGTVKTGDTILIPSDITPTRTISAQGLAGGSPTASAEERALGRDLRLVEVGDELDLAIDLSRGSVDAQTVAGRPNVEQALKFRLGVEADTDPLFPSIGVRTVIGLPSPDVNAAMVSVRVREAILADPRVASVGSLRVSPESDAINISADIEMIQVTKPERLYVRSANFVGVS